MQQVGAALCADAVPPQQLGVSRGAHLGIEHNAYACAVREAQRKLEERFARRRGAPECAVDGGSEVPQSEAHSAPARAERLNNAPSEEGAVVPRVGFAAKNVAQHDDRRSGARRRLLAKDDAADNEPAAADVHAGVRGGIRAVHGEADGAGRGEASER